MIQQFLFYFGIGLVLCGVGMVLCPQFGPATAQKYAVYRAGAWVLLLAMVVLVAFLTVDTWQRLV